MPAVLRIGLPGHLMWPDEPGVPWKHVQFAVLPKGDGSMTDGATTPYRDARAHFRLEVPEYYNFAIDTIGRWAEDPEMRALLWTDERGAREERTFRQIAERSSAIADGLRQMGVKPGDRVIMVIPPVPAWWEVFMAVMKLGAIAVPGTSQLTARDVAYRTRFAEAVALIMDESSAAKADESLADADLIKVVTGRRDGWHALDDVAASGEASYSGERTRSDDPAILYFTSGTTGYPKMVLHTHASYPIGHQITGKFWLDLGPDDLHWNLSDTGWAKAAWSSLFGPWSQGAAPSSTSVRQAEHRRHPLAVRGAPGHLVLRAADYLSHAGAGDLSKYDYGDLRSCVAAGEPLNPEVIETWKRATGLRIRDGYGQTETVVLAANFPARRSAGLDGQAVADFDVDVIGDDAQPLPPNRREISRCASVPSAGRALREYWHDPEATARSFRGEWYITGDRAYRDEDGYIWFVGRADDVIISCRVSDRPVRGRERAGRAPRGGRGGGGRQAGPGARRDREGVHRPRRGYEPTRRAGSRDPGAREDRSPRRTSTPVRSSSSTDLPKTVSGKIRRIELRGSATARRRANRARAPQPRPSP